jgi:hypothetical protein
MEIELTNPFKEFLTLMIRRHVEFMIIGGYAVNFHGFPRLTHDIDLRSIEGALIDFGFPKSVLGSELFTEEKSILRFGIPPNRIEIFSQIPGVGWSECWNNRIEGLVSGITLNWIGLAELRKNKAACHRGKDQIDLEELPDA